MSKDAPASVEVEQEFTQPVDEFCVSLSQTDRRVEMIGAFNSQEKRAGRGSDLPSKYLARYQAFCNQPA